MRALPLIVTAIVGLAVGYLAGRIGAEPSGAGRTVAATDTGAASTHNARRQGKVFDDPGALMEGNFGTVRRGRWSEDELLRASKQCFAGGSLFTAIRPIIRLADELQEEDFPLALRVAQELKIGQDGGEVFGVLALMRWVELNPRAAADFLREENAMGGLFDINSEVLFPIWAQRDPLEALQWVRTLPNADHRKHALERLVQAQARRDPDGAMAFVRAHAPELITKDGEIPEAVLDVWEKQAPEAATRRLLSAGDANKLEGAVARWAREDFPTAKAFVRSIHDEKQRASAARGLIAATAPQDFAGARKTYEELRKDGVDVPGVEEILVNYWPSSDPGGMKQWASNLPSGQQRTEAFRVMASHLAQKDAQQGAALLEEIPKGDDRDVAVEQYATMVVEKDGEAAFEWALTISDAGKRDAALARLTRQWFRHNPAAAFRWLEHENGLSAAEKRQLLLGK